MIFMKIKMCDHIDVSGIRIESSQSVFAICTIDEINLLLIHVRNATTR